MGDYKPFSHEEVFKAGKAKPFQHSEMVASGKAKAVGRADYSVGGGGGGDFSLAKVNVNYETGGARLIAPNIYEDSEYYMLLIADSGEYKIPLYRGHGVAEISDKKALVNVVTSGDITYYKEGMMFLISGDGSITISLSKD